MKHWVTIRQVGFKEDPGMKEWKLKVDGGTKLKGWSSQKPTSSWKANLKAPTLGLKVRYLISGGKHVAEFVKNCKAVSKFAIVKYKHRGLYMAMEINNKGNTNIVMPN